MRIILSKIIEDDDERTPIKGVRTFKKTKYEYIFGSGQTKNKNIFKLKNKNILYNNF